MRKLTVLLMLVAVCAITMAQSTARKLTLKNSADGQSELTVFLPQNPSGRAVVCCPGGGYSRLAMDHEGFDWAEYFNSQGVALAVLKYRMPNGDRNIPLSDAYNAIKTMRDSAQVWNVNPHDVGIMGSSAGGHLASSVSTHASFAVRPNFSILFYPVISMDQRVTHKGSCVNFLGEGQKDANLVKEWSNDRAVRRHLTPPAIILTANDDGVVPPVTNGVAYYSAMRNAGNDCSLYAYPSGGHGFGFRTTWPHHDQMLNDLTEWLKHLSVEKTTDVKVACVGNSITDGHGIDMCDLKGYPALLQKRLGAGMYVKNFGVSARTMSNRGDHPYQQELAWKDCMAWQPDVVVIKLGTNDTKPENWKYAQEDYVSSLQQMIDSLRSQPNNPRIILCSPIPAFKSTWNITDSIIVNNIIPTLKDYAAKNQMEYLDLYTPFTGHNEFVQSDGIHPNDKGVAKMAEIISEVVKSERPVFKKVKKAKKRK